MTEIFKSKELDERKVLGADVDAHAYLRWFRDIRVSFSAHRFGGARQAIAAAHVAGEGDQSYALGISFFTLIMDFDIPGFDEGVLEFIDLVAAHIFLRLEALNAKVFAETLAMPVGDLLALPKAEIKSLTLDTVRRTRNEVRTGMTVRRNRADR